MLNSIKVRTRFLILILFVVISIFSIVILSFSGKNTAEFSIQRLYSVILPVVDEANSIQNAVTNIHGLLTNALEIENNHRDLVRQNEILSELLEGEMTDITVNHTDLVNAYLERQMVIGNEIDLWVQKAIDSSANIRTRINSERSVNLLNALDANLQELNGLYDKGLNATSLEDFFMNALKYAELVDENAKGLIEMARESSELTVQNAFDEIDAVQTQMVSVAVIVISINIVLSILFAKSMTKPLDILKNNLTQMTSGDLTLEIPVDYKAEFGEMFASFKKMLENLNVLILGTKETSNDVSYGTKRIVKTLGDVKENVAIIDGNIQLLTTDVESQIASLKESAAAMDNIANGVSQIAASSTSVAELATETSTQANEGSAVIEKSVMQMETINQVVEDTSNVVDRLVKRTHTIDEALKAITGIAEQTNLLALNASIEAARAGEQGRGFAVVAEEVSKLADQSKESANEINTLLQEINEDTKEAVQAMEQGKLESKQGIEVIQQAGLAFSSIVEQVTIMTKQVQEVSSTVDEIASGTEEVNASLADVVQISKEVSNQARKVSKQNDSEIAMLNRMYDSVDETTDQVEKLDEKLGRFKIKESKAMENE